MGCAQGVEAGHASKFNSINVEKPAFVSKLGGFKAHAACLSGAGYEQYVPEGGEAGEHWRWTGDVELLKECERVLIALLRHRFGVTWVGAGSAIKNTSHSKNKQTFPAGNNINKQQLVVVYFHNGWVLGLILDLIPVHPHLR